MSSDLLETQEQTETKRGRSPRKDTDEKEFKVRCPKVAEWVQWLREGRTTNKPLPALVMEVCEQYGKACVKLLVFDGHTQIFQPHAIRHISDPFHEDHQEALRINGAWRWPE